MAEGGSWPSIQKHGLLSTSALLDLFETAEPLRSKIEAVPRPEKVPLTHERHGQAMIRDQKPLGGSALSACLENITVPEWCLLLNRKVFFWPSPKRLEGLRTANSYRAETPDILKIDSAALVAAYRPRITLSGINSGYAQRKAARRGLCTFQSIDRYESRGRDVVELAVDYAVPDVTRFILSVTRA